MKEPFHTVFGYLLLLLSLLSCQPQVWQATREEAKTVLPLNKKIEGRPSVETTIATYREQISTSMSEVIGWSEVELSKGAYQSPLGNFVVDLLLEESRAFYGQPIDLAVVTNGGLRMPLPAGEVTVGHVFELMPFENELLVLTLDGAAVQELFNFAARTGIAPVSNANYKVCAGKATNISIGGKPFNPDQYYTVVTSDYLAGGGDNMTMFSKALKKEKTGILLRDAIIRHIRQLAASGKPIEADTVPRVTIIP